uniref:Putative transcriptional regulator protein hcngp n=1 Tax=Corethrella appendiculata TaxID=1370023 RepID=U5EGX1_9DIPT
MSSSKSALASLTATYTDSENEDDNRSDDSDESQVIIPSRPNSPIKAQSSENSSTPPTTQLAQSSLSNTSATASTTTKSKTQRQKALRLVSYFDDTVVSDDENNPHGILNLSNVDNDDDEEMDVDDEANQNGNSENQVHNKQSQKKIDRQLIYGFSLPPEPKGKCPVELQEKISNLYEKMKNSNMDTNRIIQDRKEFRNPSIYEKLIQFCDINELGTNYPPEIYDPLQFGKESYYEELARGQKIEMEKIEKARKESQKNDLTSAAKKAEEDAKKRKSKWDQPAVSSSSQSQTIKPVSGIIQSQQTLTSNITGTKTTVISAFGSLPKKPKI